jgi:hypothetical protein
MRLKQDKKHLVIQEKGRKLKYDYSSTSFELNFSLRQLIGYFIKKALTLFGPYANINL